MLPHSAANAETTDERVVRERPSTWALFFRLTPRSAVLAVCFIGLILFNALWSLPTHSFILGRLGPLADPARVVFDRETDHAIFNLKDFASFVAAGRLAAAGQNPYADDPLVFRPHFRGIDVTVPSPNLNPPISVVLFESLAYVDPKVAFRVVYGTSMVLYLLTLVLLWRSFPTRDPLLRLLWALSLAGFWHILELGQPVMPLVVGAVGAWLLLRDGHPKLAGLLLGLLVAFKPNLVVWPLLLGLGGTWSAALVALGTAGLISLVPVVIYGPAIYQQWLATTAAASEGLLWVPGNSSLIGFAARLGVPWLGYLAAGLLLVVLAVWIWRHRPPVLVVSGVALVAALLASPLAWASYTLLLLPLLYGRPWSPTLRVAAGLLVVPFALVMLTTTSAPWSNVLVGGVYSWALLLVLAVLVREMRTAGQAAANPATPSLATAT